MEGDGAETNSTSCDMQLDRPSPAKFGCNAIVLFRRYRKMQEGSVNNCGGLTCSTCYVYQAHQSTCSHDMLELDNKSMQTKPTKDGHPRD
eukprot:4493236-Amphidinium_carterae.1